MQFIVWASIPIKLLLIFFLSPSLPANARPSIDFYSQNISSEHDDTDTVLYSETRIRIFPWPKQLLLPYIGGYTNPYSYGPSAGALLPLRFKFLEQFSLMAEYRKVLQKNPAPNSPRNLDESRLGLIYSSWHEFKNNTFLDSYAESIFIPRISQTPVTTLFTRYGHRTQVIPKFYFDPNVQLWGQLSNSPDLAPGGLEARPGLRLTWANSGLAVAGLVYYRQKFIKKAPNEWEGLLILQGGFQ